MVKSKPFTMRLTSDMEQWVEHEAQRTRRSKGAIVEALADEGMRMRRFPGIAFRGPDDGRRAWLLGTAFDVWEAIQGHQDFGSVELLLAAGDLPEAPLRLALAYYAAYPTEIDRAIADNRIDYEHARLLYPTLFAAD